MRTFAKVTFGLILGIGAAPIIWVVAYDLLFFQPRMPEVRTILAAAHADERSPPPALVRALKADLPDNLHWHASRLLRDALDEHEPNGSQNRSLTRRVMFGFLVNLHLSTSEQTALFLSRSYMGNGVRGFSAASPSVAGVPLGYVSIEQAALLVATAGAPFISQERLARRAEVLVQRAQNAL